MTFSRKNFASFTTGGFTAAKAGLRVFR